MLNTLKPMLGKETINVKPDGTATSFLSSKNKGSLGLVVVGSIVGGILAAKVCLNKSEFASEETSEKFIPED